MQLIDNLDSEYRTTRNKLANMSSKKLDIFWTLHDPFPLDTKLMVLSESSKIGI